MCILEAKERIDKYLKGKNITFTVKESNTTNSFYYTLYKNNYYCSFRLSDHLTNKFNGKIIKIGKSTKKEKLYRSLDNQIKSLNKGAALEELNNKGE